MTAAYYTLGCKLNFAETSSIGKQLEALGIEKETGGNADICIVNTCSVTDIADRKCRQAIRRIKSLNPRAMIVVTGCYAQLNPAAVGGIDGVDLVLGTGEKAKLAEYIADYMRSEKKTNLSGVKAGAAEDIVEFSPSCSRGNRTRYFLKVQDGCDYYCSYCAIPFARGKSRNGSIKDIVKMAESVAIEGGKEIVLTGINIGDFGKSTNEDFFQLIRALDKVDKVERFRISSIEPNLLTGEILEFIASSGKFAPHFHIPLQSGSDNVLKLMGRRYKKALFAEKVSHIRKLIPNAFIGVDVIAGSPGETNEFFKESLLFLKELPVAKLHVFTYSERKGTKALEINHRVSPEEKKDRSRQLIDLSSNKTLDFYRSQVGKQQQVIYEHSVKGGKMHGFTGNYLKIESNHDDSLVNQLVSVTLNVLSEQDLQFIV